MMDGDPASDNFRWGPERRLSGEPGFKKEPREPLLAQRGDRARLLGALAFPKDAVGGELIKQESQSESET
jgi:hypothetical protein